MRRARGGNLFGDRLAVVDDVVGAEFGHPVFRLLARRGCDHDHVRQDSGELYGDRADTTRSADDHDRVGGARHGPSDVKPVKQHFPGGDRGQRERRRLGA